MKSFFLFFLMLLMVGVSFAGSASSNNTQSNTLRLNTSSNYALSQSKREVAKLSKPKGEAPKTHKFLRFFSKKVMLSSKAIAALLCFFFGLFGLHRFYMGQKKQGFIQLGLTLLALIVAFFPVSTISVGVSLFIIGLSILVVNSIWVLIDLIRIFFDKLARN